MNTNAMKILLLGSGAREHNFALLLTKSSRCEHLFVFPGNAGTALMQNCTNVDITLPDVHSFVAIEKFVHDHKIGLVLIGPEAPLVEGLANYLLLSGIVTMDCRIIGPGADGAKLEGSKDFAKVMMNKYNIPTAKSQTFTWDQQADALDYLETIPAPYVLKSDGLAAGKGVTITSDVEEAKAELEAMFAGKFGLLNKTVVIEEFLQGTELSVIILMDEDEYIILPTSKDYKKIGIGDIGKNTGGMGAISPVPFADQKFMQKVTKRIIEPMLKALQDNMIDYWGFMYLGLMNVKGNPYVVEINCRMGDPEASAILPKIKNDFVDMLEACTNYGLGTLSMDIDDRPCATIVLVAEGYPDRYQKGKIITGLDKDFGSDVIITHAGTKLLDGNIVTNGGRVLDITCFGETLPLAISKCRTIAEQIDFEGKYYRSDIGFEFMTQ